MGAPSRSLLTRLIPTKQCVTDWACGDFLHAQDVTIEASKVTGSHEFALSHLSKMILAQFISASVMP